MLDKTKTIFKSVRAKTLIISGFLALALVLFFALKNPHSNENKIISATREKVIDIVEVAGQVEPSKDAELAFEKSGIVSKINVKVGDTVKAGKTIASLAGSDVYASVREAEAGVGAALATLAQLESGSSEAEISLKKQNLENAKGDLINAERQVEDTLNNTKNRLTDIIDYKLSAIFLKDGEQYRVSFNSCDQSTQSELEGERYFFTNINITDLTTAKSETDRVNNFIVKLQKLLTLPCSLSDPTLNDKRATVSFIKNEISTTYADISGRTNVVLAAKNAVSRAEKDLELSSSQDKNRIKNQQAFVNQAYARLAQARAQAGKNVLTAPFSGRVSEVNVELGELASQSKYAIKLIADSSYQIKSKISEIDIAKIKIGNTATVTLDAYPNVEFLGIVTSIDPASKNEAGVPRYGVTLTFVNFDTRIKSGMTSSAKIITETKEGALTIPSSYIQIKSGGGIVKVKNGETEEERIVKTGIRSQNGNIEILEGLTESDKLVEIAKEGTVIR